MTRVGVGRVVVDGFPGGAFIPVPLADIAAPKGRRFMAGCGDCRWCMVTIMAWAADLPAQR